MGHIWHIPAALEHMVGADHERASPETWHDNSRQASIMIIALGICLNTAVSHADVSTELEGLQRFSLPSTAPHIEENSLLEGFRRGMQEMRGNRTYPVGVP